MKRIFILSAVIIATLVGVHWAAAGQASGSIAAVVAVKGQVTAINQEGVARALAIKDPLFVEDIVRTGAQGRIQLLFSDATIISLAPVTEMKLAEYQWDPEAKSGKMKTEVKEGTFRVMGGAMTKFAPKNFTTETPTATIGIRGSMYAGTVKGNSLSVVFQGGKGIDITNSAGTVAITKPGFGSQVSGSDQPPSPPRKLSAQELGAINQALTSAQKVDEQKAIAAEEGQTPETETKTAPDPAQDGAGEMDGPQSETLAAGTEAPGPGTVSGGESLLETGGAVAVQPETQGSGTAVAPTISAYYDPTANPANQPEVAPQAPPVTEKPPAEGSSRYLGTFQGLETIGGASITGDLLMAINWQNGKAVGIFEDQSLLSKGPPSFFWGSVTGNTMTIDSVFGSVAGDPNDPAARLSALLGMGTGSFSGATFDSFDAVTAGSGYSLAVSGTPLVSSWNLTATATAMPQDASDLVAPTGFSKWAGFAVGISENTNAPDIERKIFMNHVADAATEQFTLAVDRDAGTISGILRAPQLNRGVLTYGAMDLEIGGAYGSAYVRNHGLAAKIGCAGNCINDDATASPALNVGLNPYGNFLIPEAPDYQFSEYVTWGYWEISHQEADGPDPDAMADMYHTHVPYSMWIAGERTPASVINTFLNNTTFIGQYEGIAQGEGIDSANHAFPLHNGRALLSIDFGQAVVASAVRGALTFDEVTLGIDSAAAMLSNQGFKASIVNPGVLDSAVNGAFYGPGVNAIGGNFQAEFSTRRYLGIFGGALVNGPAH